MIYLLLDQLERVGFIIATAFLFSRQQKLRHFMSHREGTRNLRRFILLFSFFAILGTYSGVRITAGGYIAEPFIGQVSGTEAIANSRTIGVVIAGLLGGVKAGLAVGAIAGVHRYFLGGFVALPCMIATILQGWLAGMMKNSLKKRYKHISSVQLAFVAGFAAESLQMILILLLARPFEAAASLIWLIGIPQTIANSLGVASFFLVLIQVQKEEEKIGATHTRKAFQIAEKTQSHWRKPLREAVQEITQILVQETEAVGTQFIMESEVIAKEGRITSFEASFPVGREPRMLGFFRLYFEREQDLYTEDRATILHGLSQLFTQQYALAEAERHEHLVASSEIKALQAQMNPHFLFNVLNTIKSLIRTKPDDARLAITQLAKYLRKNMQNANQDFITIREELEHVEVYLDLVKTRMGERLCILWDIDASCLEYTLPPLTIQPLVENAIVHGLKNTVQDGKLNLSVKEERNGIRITVEDNGAGMERSLETKDKPENLGLALNNIQHRLQFYFGKKADWVIESAPSKGTRVSFVRPK
ncbi:histidine kinase [Fodinisporobacter ferrooxydans]|uniref:Histidine kinase n=1 Tax=Fodinisporobacter ferrooxydans TaxID=2901836 RepID=A0ABY4CF94_9BACL|nr:histidine kinase [Alicyclobacillaceae bacterium MYW30-H2]